MRRRAAFLPLLLLLAFPAGLRAVAVQREQVALPEDPWHEEVPGSGFRAQGPLAPDWEDLNTAGGRRPGTPRLMRQEAPARGGRASEPQEPERLMEVEYQGLEASASLLAASGQGTGTYAGRRRPSPSYTSPGNGYPRPAPSPMPDDYYGDGGEGGPQSVRIVGPQPAPQPMAGPQDMQDGGAPPDLANSPYFPADEQASRCSEGGGREMTRQECQEAAGAVAFTWGGIVDVPTQPRSCACQAGANPQTGKCMFNEHLTGSPNPSMRLMCKKSGPPMDDSSVYNGVPAPPPYAPPIVQQAAAPEPAPAPPPSTKTTTTTTSTTTTAANKSNDTANATNATNATAGTAAKGPPVVFIGAGLLICCVGGGGVVAYQQRQGGRRGKGGGEDGEEGEGGGGEPPARVGDWVNVLSKGKSGEVVDFDEQKWTYMIRFEDGSSACVPASDIESAFGGGDADFAEAPEGNPP